MYCVAAMYIQLAVPVSQLMPPRPKSFPCAGPMTVELNA